MTVKEFTHVILNLLDQINEKKVMHKINAISSKSQIIVMSEDKLFRIHIIEEDL